MPRVSSDFPEVKIDIDVYGHKVTIDLAEWADVLLVDPNNLPEQMERVSRQFFDIAQYAACAVATAERRKQTLEIWQAEKWRDIFDNAGGRGEKLPTVDNAKAIVKADPKFGQLSDRYADAREDASLLENARDAVKMKQFMLSRLAIAEKAEGN